MSSTNDVRNGARKQRGGSTAGYRDRPTDDGMKGDGADQPNEGNPRLPRQGPSKQAHQSSAEPTTPGRPHDTSRQQKHEHQNLESGSESLNRQSTDEAARPPKPPGPK
jgi:hypothetical protein